MKVFYEEGEKIQSFGVAGEFKQGEPREIPDDLAEVLIKKGRLKKYEDPSTSGSTKLAEVSGQAAKIKAVSAKKED
jgi:hypothetical protein